MWILRLRKRTGSRRCISVPGYGETGVDAYYRQHYEGASAAGLKVGFYHYMDAVTEEGARRQAAHFAALIRDLPADCRPVMDFETFGGMDREEAGAVGLAFLEAVEETLGQRPWCTPTPMPPDTAWTIA